MKVTLVLLESAPRPEEYVHMWGDYSFFDAWYLVSQWKFSYPGRQVRSNLQRNNFSFLPGIRYPTTFIGIPYPTEFFTPYPVSQQQFHPGILYQKMSSPPDPHKYWWLAAKKSTPNTICKEMQANHRWYYQINDSPLNSSWASISLTGIYLELSL